MNNLYPNIFVKIKTFLSEWDALQLLSTCKGLHRIKNIVKWNTCTDINRIINLFYYNQFTHLLVSNLSFTKPKSLDSLTFDTTFVSDLHPDFLSSISTLLFPSYYPKTLKHKIPFGIKCLKLPDINNYSKSESKTLDNIIPASVVHLTLGSSFKFSLKGIIPNSVTHLTFTYFNSIEDIIPNSVTHLTFGEYFDKPVAKGLPVGLKYLKFGRKFNQSVKGCIPRTVEYLEFGKNFDQELDSLPNLKHLIFGQDFNQLLPSLPSLVHLVLGMRFTRDICIEKSIIHLSIDNIPKFKIPENVRDLEFGEHFNHCIDGLIPKSVKSVRFGSNFNKSIDTGLPEKLERLYLGFLFNMKIKKLPETLRWLELGHCFKQDIRNIIPEKCNFI